MSDNEQHRAEVKGWCYRVRTDHGDLFRVSDVAAWFHEECDNEVTILTGWDNDE